MAIFSAILFTFFCVSSPLTQLPNAHSPSLSYPRTSLQVLWIPWYFSHKHSYIPKLHHTPSTSLTKQNADSSLRNLYASCPLWWILIIPQHPTPLWVERWVWHSPCLPEALYKPSNLYSHVISSTPWGYFCPCHFYLPPAWSFLHTLLKSIALWSWYSKC